MVNTAAQFDKAVAIVKALPPDGPVKPSQDDQLAVSGCVLHQLEAVRFTSGECCQSWSEITDVRNGAHGVDKLLESGADLSLTTVLRAL